MCWKNKDKSLKINLTNIFFITPEQFLKLIFTALVKDELFAEALHYWLFCN